MSISSICQVLLESGIIDGLALSDPKVEQGEYNAYAESLFFAPLLEKHSFLPTLHRIINIPTHED